VIAQAREDQIGLRMCMNKVVSEFLMPGYTNNLNKPKVLVTMWMATVVASWFLLYGVKDFEDTEIATVRRMTMVQVCDDAITSYKLLSPSMQSKCDEFVVGEVGLTYPADGLIGMAGFNKTSLECAIVSTRNTLDLQKYKSLLKDLHETIKTLPKRTTSGMGWSIAKARLNVALIDYQFQRLSECYIHKIRTCDDESIIAKTDPVHEEWWKVGGSYIELLKMALKEAKEEKPAVDWFAVATLNAQLLLSMVSGASKTVSYSEVEAVNNDLKTAVANCTPWAPIVWEMEMDLIVKIVNDEILPCILRESGEDDKKSAFIHVFTAGFLDILKRGTVWQRLYGLKGKTRECSYCGEEGDGMLKCGAVSLEIFS
jgi:hypothetical protein